MNNPNVSANFDRSKVPQELINAYMEKMRKEETAGSPVYPKSSAKITRDYIDSLLIIPRYLDAVMPDTTMELFGRKFDTPVMTGALSHLNSVCPNGMTEMAKGAAQAHAVMWAGTGSKEELEAMVATGASVIKIIKPYADISLLKDRIDHAKGCNVLAVGIDIDHAINRKAQFDSDDGIPLAPLSSQVLKELVAYAEIPMVIKGVLSVADACKCAQAGVAGIVLSHHNGRIDYAVPPMLMLPEIRNAVGDTMKIFVDCSLNSGVDAFKALALGADACSYGRHLRDALAKGGAEGVASEIVQLNRELKHAMGMTACGDIRSIDRSLMYHRSF